MHTRKIIIQFVVISVVILLIIGTATGIRILSAPKNSERVYQVHSETVENIIEIAGTISAAQEQELQAAGDGTITGVYVAAGDTVKKGDLVMKIDDTSQLFDLEQQDYEIEQAQIDGALRDLDILLKQREVLRQKLEDRLIKANFDGIVAYLDVAEGDYLEAKDVVGTMIDRSYLKALVEVAETDAPKLRAGQKVSFSFPAYEGHIVEGFVVSSYAVASITDRGASVVKTEVRINNPPDIILPNYSFTGEIEISPPETILLVERQAIGYAPDGTPFAEKILPDGSTQRVTVEVEAYGTSFVKILSGVNNGDRLKQQLQEGGMGRMRIRQTEPAGASRIPSSEEPGEKYIHIRKTSLSRPSQKETIRTKLNVRGSVGSVPGPGCFHSLRGFSRSMPDNPADHRLDGRTLEPTAESVERALFFNR